MDTTWIEIGGVLVRSPVTAGTNLVLAVQCSLYFRALRSLGGERERRWAGFFLMMAVATLAGVFKHGARHAMSEELLVAVLAISSAASGVSTWYAQRATVVGLDRAGPSRRLTRMLERLVDAQLALYAFANVVLGPEMSLLIANTAIGLLPVIAVEAVRWARDAEPSSAAGSGRIASGLGLSLLTGAVYLTGLSLGPWLNHIDIAHLLMGSSFALVRSGLDRTPGGTSWT